MVQMLVVRAGATDYDEQGRIKGTLDIPLSDAGQGQVGRLIAELHGTQIDHLYASHISRANPRCGERNKSTLKPQII